VIAPTVETPPTPPVLGQRSASTLLAILADVSDRRRSVGAEQPKAA
jgi:hypothetical protein